MNIDTRTAELRAYLRRNADFERECLEAARKEMGLPLNCSLRDAQRITKRAQEIKLERMTKGKGKL